MSRNCLNFSPKWTYTANNLLNAQGICFQYGALNRESRLLRFPKQDSIKTKVQLFLNSKAATQWKWNTSHYSVVLNIHGTKLSFIMFNCTVFAILGQILEWFHWSTCTVAGLDKNLNSSLPFWQARHRICLPEPISLLPGLKKFSGSLIIHEARTKISQSVWWVITLLYYPRVDFMILF